MPFKRSDAGVDLVCRVTQLRRLTDQLRERDRLAVGIRREPFEQVLDAQAEGAAP